MPRTIAASTAYAIVRLYFPAGIHVPGMRGLRRLWGRPLLDELLRAARETGIEQALAFNVTAGYLRGEALRFHHTPDHPSPKHPQCVELVDTPARIALFLERHAQLLNEVRVLVRQESSYHEHLTAHR